MTQVGKDTLGTRSTLTVNGKDYAYYSFAKAAEKLGDVSKLPFSLKVLLENMLRFEDGGFTVSTDDAQAAMRRFMKAGGQTAEGELRLADLCEDVASQSEG